MILHVGGFASYANRLIGWILRRTGLRTRRGAEGCGFNDGGILLSSGAADAATVPAFALSAGAWFVGALVGAAIAVLILLLVGRALDRGVRSIRLRGESERLESEVALARAEARFRTVFEGAPLGILVIDVDGTLRETNAAFDAMLAYDRGDLIGKLLADITDEADRERTVESFGALIRGEITSYEHEKRYKRRNGSTMWATSATYVAEDDAPPAIAIVDDVSDRIVIRTA